MLTWRRWVADVQQVQAVHRRHRHHLLAGIQRQLQFVQDARSGGEDKSSG
jgi:hypothetical protein